MRIKKQNQSYAAYDVYAKWKRLVATAQDSITIYTPFFDQLLPSLMKANKHVDPDKITIVTDFSPDSMLELPNQLRTIKKSLTDGISILTLPGLHAKILLIDDKYVSVGSQNFTCRGRRNKEASVFSSASLEDSRFMATLIEWRKQATNIDENFVDLLLSKLRHRLKKHGELHKEFQKDFDEIQKAFEDEKKETMRRKLEELERQSHIRMANGVIYASIQPLFGELAYNSLLADSGYDMTNWIMKKEDGGTIPYKLKRLSMYPAILADTLRMGFARIGKTRITYIRKDLNWTDKRLKIGDLSLKVEINFPESRTTERNVKVKLSDSYRGSCEFTCLFTGDSVNNIKRRYFKGNPHWQEEHKAFTAMLENAFFGSASAVADFFGRFFTPFTFAELRRDHKNIKDYLKGWRYRLSVIQYQSNPFLVITKQ